MAALLLAARFIAGALLCLFALAKLIPFPASAHVMWRPTWLAVGPMTGVVCAVALAELALGVTIAFGALPPLPTLVSCGGVALVVSTYGTVALGRIGRCGCGTPLGGTAAAAPRLWTRNVALFGGGGIVAAAGPTAGDVAGGAGGLAPLAAVLPAAALVGALLLRLGATVHGGRAVRPRVTGLQRRRSDRS